MGGLRKRKWGAKSGKKADPLSYVWKEMYKAVPWFKETTVGIDKGDGHKTATGRYPGKGRHVADWELDVWSANDDPTDVIVKINLWGAGGQRDGESYRVSIARAENVARKIAIWIDERIQKMKKR